MDKYYNQIKIYDLLFEQTTSTDSSSNLIDPEKIAKNISDELKPTIDKIEKRTKEVEGYLDQLTKNKPRVEPPKTPATKSPTGPTPATSATPAGMSGKENSDKNKKEDSSNIKNVLKDQNFIRGLANELSPLISQK